MRSCRRLLEITFMSASNIYDLCHRHRLERRGEKRRIQRLNWGKTLSINEIFLCECVISNLTSKGAGLHLMRQVYIPRFFLLYVDISCALYEAELIWRNGATLGCKLAVSLQGARSPVIRRMQARYYGL